MQNISTNNSELAPKTKRDLQTIWAEDPMQVIVLLFDKTLLHISRARASLTGWGDEPYQANVLNAVDVIRQLQLTLNMNSQQMMAENLNDLYGYVTRMLVNSINDQNLSSLNEASDLLMQIRESLSIFVKKSSKVLQH